MICNGPTCASTIDASGTPDSSMASGALRSTTLPAWSRARIPRRSLPLVLARPADRPVKLQHIVARRRPRGVGMNYPLCAARRHNAAGHAGWRVEVVVNVEPIVLIAQLR